MDFEVKVWTGTERYARAYSGRYETRDGGVLLVIDDETGKKITYGPTGWLSVEEESGTDHG
jgi:hypothetical protein